MRLGLVALIAASAIARADVEYAPPPLLPTIEQRLPSGMLVIVAPDPSVASVAVHVRYLGGTDDEVEPAGITHLIERLLFAGSTHVRDGELEQRIETVSGWASSEVTPDYLATFEEVPAQALELVLWLEAERMAGLTGGLTEARVAREKATIAAERDANAVEDALEQRLWGKAPRRDGELQALSLRAVKNLVARQLDPAKTVVVIAGHVDPAAAIVLAQKYLGWIPGPQLARELKAVPEVRPLVAAPPPVETPDPVPKVVIAFRTNKPYAADTVALELAARILAGGRTSRLQHQLVDGGLATEIHAEMIAKRRGGELRIVATAKPGVDPTRLETAIRAALAELRAAPLPAAEIARVAIAEEADLVASLENLAVRASAIADWALGAGASSYLETARASLRGVTPDDLQRAAGYWLAESAMVTVIGR